MRQFCARFIFTLFSLIAIMPAVVSAQSGTPVGGRDVPDASECTVAPGVAADVLALFREMAATPTAPSTSGTANPTPFVPPSGQPADAETTAAIVTATREIIACTNSYGFLGLVTVSTHRHIRDIMTVDLANGMTEADVAAFYADTPEPPTPEQSVAFGEVRDVVVLDDGRVGALVVGDEPGAPSYPLYFIFVKENDRYLLDEEYDLLMEGTPTA